MDSCKCPITGEIFEDPVVGDDGHTYERKAIAEWLTKNGTSPITRQFMNIQSLRTDHMVKKMIEELRSASQSQQMQYQFQLNVDIHKTRTKPLFQGFGKSIYEVDWINRKGPPIILLKIDGAKARREASFYSQLSCHPHIVRTFGLVQSNPGSVMLLQECAPHGDLSELLRENRFEPAERVLRKMFEQICDAMICLAENGIIHGDLACRNVLVFRFNPNKPEENLVKLTDFGLTRASTIYSVADSPSMSTMTIIPVRYAAPEILRNLDKSSHSEKSDIYSMGVLMWEACSYGQLPYSSIHNDSDVQKQKLNDERLLQPSQCSHQLWTIINECWQQEPFKRPTFVNLKELLLTFEIKSADSRQKTSPLIVNRVKEQSVTHGLEEIAYIPCEYCEEHIDLSNWSIHTETCREHEKTRLKTRAREISQEPITAQLPCEYCQKMCSAKELQPHQANCNQNPHHKTQTASQNKSCIQPAMVNFNKTKPINTFTRCGPVNMKSKDIQQRDMTSVSFVTSSSNNLSQSTTRSRIRDISIPTNKSDKKLIPSASSLNQMRVNNSKQERFQPPSRSNRPSSVPSNRNRLQRPSKFDQTALVPWNPSTSPSPQYDSPPLFTPWGQNRSPSPPNRNRSLSPPNRNRSLSPLDRNRSLSPLNRNKFQRPSKFDRTAFVPWNRNRSLSPLNARRPPFPQWNPNRLQPPMCFNQLPGVQWSPNGFQPPPYFNQPPGVPWNSNGFQQLACFNQPPGVPWNPNGFQPPPCFNQSPGIPWNPNGFQLPPCFNQPPGIPWNPNGFQPPPCFNQPPGIPWNPNGFQPPPCFNQPPGIPWN